MKILSLTLVALASCQGPHLEQPERPGRTETTAQSSPAALTSVPISIDVVRDALRRSLPFVEEQGVAWMDGKVPIQEGSPCVSCHHVGYSLWSQKEAQRAGIEPSPEIFDSLSSRAVEFLAEPGVPRAYAVSSVLLSEERPSEGLVQALRDLQNEDGHWHARGQFPSQRRPGSESDSAATLWSLLSLAGTLDTEPFGAVRDRAFDWLDGQDAGETTEWLAARLAVAEAFANEDEAQSIRAQLLRRQNDDGGWGWQEGDASEAFSTGQALYALAFRARGGDLQAALETSRDQPAFRAVQWLLEAQHQDGSWPVPSAAVSQEPEESKDVIYHFWGTAWASIGLSRFIAAQTAG
ncbi:MAG: terpene cyclase/mutase family protein [Deltaproteobacteria bacterium]|nr:terpene cyclase/mutase family protein [Deltaproteobacteria bacterium]